MVQSPLADFAEMRELVEFSALINSSLDIQLVLDRAMAFVEHLLQAESSSIFEIDQEHGDLFVRLARGEKAQAIKELRLKFGEGIAGLVASTEEPLLIRDVCKDPRFCQRFDEHSGYSTRSILCVPLKSRERLVGVLEVLNKKDLRGFDERDREVLILVGNLIGTALENAYLYSRLQDRLSATMEELKISQEKLLRSQRLAALGMMAQGVAHEVRNPVAVIGGFVHRLKKYLGSEDLCCMHLDIITSELHKLERMVKEIEAFAKVNEPVLKPTNLYDLINTAVAAQAVNLNEQGVRVECVPAALPRAPVDPDLLSLALRHLISNALEAMPQGGLLKITVAGEPNSIHLTVRDTGAGIEAKDLPHIFDPFYSTKPQGTGMGLTIVHHIIDIHGGEIRLESEPGLGTTVHVWLPKDSTEY